MQSDTIDIGKKKLNKTCKPHMKIHNIQITEGKKTVFEYVMEH